MRYRLHGTLSPFFGHQYILVAVDYVSKWVEAISCRSNDHKVVIGFLKSNVVSRFGFPFLPNSMKRLLLLRFSSSYNAWFVIGFGFKCLYGSTVVLQLCFESIAIDHELDKAIMHWYLIHALNGVNDWELVSWFWRQNLREKKFLYLHTVSSKEIVVKWNMCSLSISETEICIYGSITRRLPKTPRLK